MLNAFELAEDAKYADRLMFLNNWEIAVCVVGMLVICWVAYYFYDKAVKRSSSINWYDVTWLIVVCVFVISPFLIDNQSGREKELNDRYRTYVSSLETVEATLADKNVVSYSIVPRKGNLYADLVVRDAVGKTIKYRTLSAEIRSDLMAEGVSLLTYKKLPVTIEGYGKKGEIDVVLHVRKSVRMDELKTEFDRAITPTEL